MNQILMSRTAEDSEKQLKKVIKFFAVFIILFGLVFIAEGAWGYLKIKNRKVKINTPDISVEKSTDVTVLNIASDIGISEVKYFWNITSEGIKGNTIEEKTNGQKNVRIEIPNLNGTNELNLEILDSNGNIIKYEPIIISYNIEDLAEEDWETAVSNDKTKPTIKLEGSNGKVKVIASDNLRMSYIVYKWNDGEETTITGLSDDEKYIESEIEVLEGENKLTVKAYDRAGNEEVVEKTIQGVKGPSIKVIREDEQIVINIDDDDKITKIVYNFNGEEKTIENINEKTYEIRLDLVDGENYVILDAYRDDIKSSYKGKTTK